MREDGHGGNVLALAAARGADWRTFVDFSASINPLGPPPEVLELLRAEQAIIAHYPQRHNPALLTALGRYAGVCADHLLVGNGAAELIYFTLRFLKPRAALVALPTFSEFPRACALNEVVCDTVDFIRPRPAGWCKDWQAVEDALTTGRYDLLVLVHPNNPTGATLDTARGERLLQVAGERGVTVLLDESFIDFAPEDSWIDAIARHPHLIVLRSLTKFFALPGLRLGYLATDPARIVRMHAVREPWPVNQLAQMAGERCAGLIHYQEATRQLVDRERAVLADALQQLPGVSPFPSRVNFLLVALDARHVAVSAAYEHLLSRRIIVRRCDGWPGVPDNCMRVAVRRREDNRRLLDELKDYLCSTS